MYFFVRGQSVLGFSGAYINLACCALDAVGPAGGASPQSGIGIRKNGFGNVALILALNLPCAFVDKCQRLYKPGVARKNHNTCLFSWGSSSSSTGHVVPSASIPAVLVTLHTIKNRSARRCSAQVPQMAHFVPPHSDVHRHPSNTPAAAAAAALARTLVEADSVPQPP